ncbi:MAG: phenylalanine--tRNA ligase beta subunit-related protein, partial [Patescibacteria group bacterium]
MPKGDLLIDVKITPNRSHDCLSYDGLAREFALSNDLDFGWQRPWKEELSSFPISKTRELSVNIAEPALCKRYVGRVIENIKVGESPEWLKERLTSIGQRSINNVVDSANYIMWITGQPMHAFDADKL